MSIILFILILSLIIVIHELGHFIFAKLAGVYVYEFSLGMGKRIWYTKKGETEYSIRLIPLGGYVSMAGESVEDDKKIPKNKKLQSKTLWQRFLIMFAGPGFNFILAIVIFLISALLFGSVSTSPIIGDVSVEYPAYKAGVKSGDLILEINDKKIKSWDDVMWEIQINSGKTLNFKLQNGTSIRNVSVTPDKIEENNNNTYVYGIARSTDKKYGIAQAFEYTYSKTISTFKLMFNTVKSLFIGSVGVDELSGPVGIYTVVDSQAKAGADSLLYLIAFLSINVGVINLLPFPAFDGGHILFLIIEKIKGSPVNPKVENTIHNIGFMLLILLMIYVTFNDVFRLIK